MSWKWCLAPFFFASLVVSAQILGTKPAYLAGLSTSFANDQAVSRKIWVPGLDDDYVPQGLAVDGHSVLVSAYRSAEAKGAGASCRIFRVDMATGRETGRFDAPPRCGHAAGLANLTGGMIVLADIHDLWRIDLEKALETGSAQGAVRGHVKLGGELEGHFAGFDGADLWIGIYTVQKDAARAKMHRLPLRIFDEDDGRTIDERWALESVAVPPLGQGAAIEGDSIWMAASSSRIGALYRLDRRTGQVLARYDTVTGIEGIAFDFEGRLWAVSEAGAKKYLHWAQHFPAIFAVDVAKLR
jgi:hypothetical protein